MIASLLVAAALAGCLADDGASDALTPTDDGAPDIPREDEPRQAEPTQLYERFEERPVGIEREMRFLYGPFTIPPGQDLNRLTVEVPVNDGFLVAVNPNLYFADTGEVPSNQQLHIHHAHWFRTSQDADDEYYTLNLAWVFGTGEERTSGSFHDRADADPDGPRYGIHIEPLQPQALIYMLHNKMAQAVNVYVSLDVRFVYGDQESILAAGDCGEELDGEVCRAGEEFHHLHGKLWGTTFDVPREPIADGGDGLYIHPIDIAPEWDTRRDTDHLGRFYTASHDGTMIATAGHLHPNGSEVVLANLGPEGSGCEADLDGDGLPGVTLLRSKKIEQVPEAFPHSEEYQMGASAFGWRAPMREGDRITQYAVYDNDDYASYAAMSFVGLYTDRQQVPEPRGPEGCTLENTQATVLGAPDQDPTEGIWNRGWSYDAPAHCGIEIGLPACERELDPASLPDGLAATQVHIADFLYLPGDQSLDGELGAPIAVSQGDTVTFVNEDAAAGIRHTVTSCKWPCNGPYVANYPHPDGVFHSGKMGNLDPIDGGGLQTNGEGPLGLAVAGDALPIWELDTADLEKGLHAYYCLIHPWMRGWIDVQ